MRSRILVAIVVLGLFLGHAIAQDQSDLDRLEDKFSRHVATKMPGWKHQRVEPMAKVENVLIEFWTFRNRKIKISVIPHKSASEAREVVQRFMKYQRQKEELKGFGDEAYAWGYALSRVVFRRGRFTVYVSTYADVSSDPDARMLSQSEKGRRERSEMKLFSTEFAKHMASAIDAP